MPALRHRAVGQDAGRTGGGDPAPAGGVAAPGAVLTRPRTSPTLVGREPELEALAGTLSGTPSLALIEGEAGIGKTRLVQELRSRPELAGRRFLVAGALPIQEPFPLGPVLELVRGLAGDLATVRLSPVTGALRPLLPELSDLLPPPPEALADGTADRHRIFRGLLELLHELCPATVVIEDLHWADHQTIDLLHYVLRDPPGGLSMVVTYRGEEVDSRVPGLAWALPAGQNRTQLALHPLDVAQTGQLAAAILATASNSVSPDLAADLCERTGGVPFAIEEVMALLRGHDPGSGWGDRQLRQALADLRVPTAVRNHVLARALRLPDRARSAMEALAVLRRAAPEQLVAAVSAEAPEWVSAGLTEAIEAGLLVDEGEAVGFRHVLAAQAIYHGIPGPRRRTLHGRAAAALPAAGSVGGRTPEVLGQVAYHLRQAGRLAEWAVAAERAADRAIALGHHDEAVRLLAEVLRQAPLAPADAGRLAVKLGWAATEALHLPAVADLLAQALEGELAPAVRAELQMLLGVELDRVHAGSERARELFRAVAANPASRGAIRAWAMVAAEMRNPIGAISYPGRQRAVSQVLEILPTVGDRDFQIFLLGKVGMQLADSGDPRWREVVGRVEELTAGRPRQRRQGNAYHTLSEGLSFAGHHREADRLLAAAKAGAEACHDPRLATLVRSSRLHLSYRCGHWENLPEEIGRLQAELADQPLTAYPLDTVTAGLALAAGDFATAEQVLARVLAHAERYDFFEPFPTVIGPLLRLALARGDREGALATTKRYLAGLPEQMVWPGFYRGLPWLTQALVVAGEPGWAGSVVSWCARELSGRDAPLEPAALPHARGHLASAAGDPRQAAALFGAAADQYEALCCRYEAAQARESAAGALAEAGRPESGAGLLRAAMAAYQALGADWDLDRAKAAARQHGVPVPARRRGGHHVCGAELSAREREVAELAAAGLTNKQIGAQLFLSAETVKKYLQSAMRKLDVRSRVALVRQLPPA